MFLSVCHILYFTNLPTFVHRIQRLSGERDHHKSTVARVTRQHEALERTLAQESEKLRQLSSRHKLTASKLKAEKDEVAMILNLFFSVHCWQGARVHFPISQPCVKCVERLQCT